MKAPSKGMKDAFQKRMKSTIARQKESFEKIAEGRPMDAETDPKRKMAFLQKQMGVSGDIIEQIANYENPKDLNLTEALRSKAESLQGASIDFMGVSFLDVARAASRSVARIVLSNGEPLGTGFMISPHLLITNHHVIENEEQARAYQLEFNYELDYQSNPVSKSCFAIDPDRFFVTAAEEDLDYTVVAVGKKISGEMDLKDFGFLPLINSDDKHMNAIFVNCIQHPNGEPKQLVVRENRLLTRTPNTLIYSSDTLPGSSGSPIFNDNWEVLALHHYGAPYRSIVDQPNGLPKNGNEGIRISAIIARLKTLKNLSQDQNTLLTQALNTSFRPPSLMTIKKEEAIDTSIKETQPKNTVMENTNGKPDNTIKLNQAYNNGVVSLTIPLTISISLGTPQVPGSTMQALHTNGQEEKAKAAATRKFIPESDYATREGYDPAFLGKKVPLPKLTDAQKKAAAKNNMAEAGDNPLEFKYHHFSLFMNAKRRVAFFTAVNIDGASVVSINRQTGQVTKGPESLDEDFAEGREKWYDDPRIDESEVCHDDIYKDPSMRSFQRGHLVKRTDPSWGNADVAWNGQADTFHFTNCSPQHAGFNPNKLKWAGVEDWITKTSDDQDIKVSVFSGPVFGKKDPEVNGLLIPKAFWKVVSWVENGKLNATAIIADQSMLLKDLMQEKISGDLDTVPEKLPKEYHCSIQHIEDLTQLDFGNLSNYDTYNGPESFQPVKELNNFEELLPGRKMVREVLNGHHIDV